jgi:hypothetical protein
VALAANNSPALTLVENKLAAEIRVVASKVEVVIPVVSRVLAVTFVAVTV